MMLPIDAVLPSLREALSEQSRIILQAPPGSGKTTGLPLWLLQQPDLNGVIYLLEPRRIAARAAARRLAENLGEAVGQTIGLRTRFDHQISDRTRLVVVTAGLFVRLLQQDPELNGVCAVLFDEFHERRLDSDLALTLCLESQQGLRDVDNPLWLLVMSATLDSDRLQAFLAPAAHVQVPVSTYPLTLHYRPVHSRDRWQDTLYDVVREAHGTEEEGDLLVFLPGVREIRQLESRLQGVFPHLSVLTLYGAQSPQEQDRLYQPTGARRIILATNLAESSVTLPGVNTVIDSGYERRPEYDRRRDWQQLPLRRIARHSAEQRAGRANRQGPGRCFRLWSPELHATLLESRPAEIDTVALHNLLLELQAWGVRRSDQLNWLTPPNPHTMARAEAHLVQLQLLNDGGLTPLGIAVVELGLGAETGVLLLVGQEKQRLNEAAVLAALLEQPPTQEQELSRLVTERYWDQGVAKLYCRRLRGHWQMPDLSQVDERWIALLLPAYPHRIGLRRGGRIALSNGQQVRLGENLQRLVREEPVLVLQLGEGTEGLEARLVAGISAALWQFWIAQRARHQVHCFWDDQRQRAVAQRGLYLGQLLLGQAEPCELDPTQAEQLLLQALSERELRDLPWTAQSQQLLHRVARMRQLEPQTGWPDWQLPVLMETLSAWLGPYLQGARSVASLARLDLVQILWSQLSYVQQRMLEQQLPSHYALPSGRPVALDYAGEQVMLRVRMQELYGVDQHPAVAAGRLPLTLELLSPAQRPLQITQDLAGFWRGSYLEIRKEMRGRYPKHEWPEQPWLAPARPRAGRSRA